VKLKYLEKWNAARRWQSRTLPSSPGGNRNLCSSEAVGAQSVWHLYVIRTEHRDTLKEHLASRALLQAFIIGPPFICSRLTRIWVQAGDFPVTEQYAQRILSLPMYAELTPELIDCVCQKHPNFPLRKPEWSWVVRAACQARYPVVPMNSAGIQS